jgi:hypothetical protein
VAGGTRELSNGTHSVEVEVADAAGTRKPSRRFGFGDLHRPGRSARPGLGFV